MNADTLLLLLLPLLLLLVVIALMEIRKLRRQLESGSSTSNDELFHQFEAYHFLRDRLDLKQGMAFTSHWSASPDFLKLIAGHCLDNAPSVIVECSSGVTSLVLARCCQLNRSGHLTSLEDGEIYAGRTHSELARYELQSWGNILHAPLQPYELDDTSWQWYSLEQLPDAPIDMLVIDGPSGFIQPRSRYPALPLLMDRLAPGCTIFLDDAARQDEQDIVALWRQAYPQLQYEYIRTQRGCAVLRLAD